MIVEFDKSFEKSISRLKDKLLAEKVEKLIDALEKAESLSQIGQVKKLAGFKTYYRFKLSDYRLGFEKIDDNTIRFIILAHRKDVYKIFP